ncbi:hypothetical protein HYH02_003596 [Chlamydomonas schloesseri]|uniref:Uncharacterized protein n=1 Tax=Chlamydomonas schloesseri TaxID=2026947 RepID=A0A836BA09_9CHLO|nr:hypothetical protein HYH02_003596 [Chlamydomonas schloesseri]|eukprot:KAG2451820.1 hypothetical protein HYH02_003596 [Chlamydomonas schloesseri]
MASSEITPAAPAGPSAEQKSGMAEGSLRGVSLRFLSDFAAKVPSDFSTNQIVSKYIAPKCRGQPFVDLVSLKYVGSAQHYIIHCWSCNFLSDLVVPLLQHFIGDPNTEPAVRAQILSSTYVWLDCFSCPQQQPAPAAPKPGEEAPPAPTPLADLSVRRRTVDDAMRQCSTVLLMLDSGGAALHRTWAMYEVARALAVKGGAEALHVPVFEFALDVVYEPLQGLNLNACRAYSPADHRDLLSALSRHFAEKGAGPAGEGEAVRRSPRLSGALGAATRAIISGIQDALVGEAQQLIRAGVRSGPRYLACLRKAAEALRLGKAPLAEVLAVASLKEHRKALGESDAATLSSTSNLALLRRSQGRNAEAEELLRAVLEGRRQVLGLDHPDTAASCDHLAWLLQDMGKLEAAADMYKQALDISSRVLGEDHPDTASSCNNLAGVLQSLGRLEEAEPLLKRSLEVTIKALGERHAHTATNYNNLGVLYRAKGDVKAARSQFASAHEITSAVLGPDHPDTVTAAANLGLALQAEGRLAEAEHLLRTARESAETYLGKYHPSTKATLMALSGVLSAQGNADEAAELSKLAAAETPKQTSARKLAAQRQEQQAPQVQDGKAAAATASAATPPTAPAAAADGQAAPAKSAYDEAAVVKIQAAARGYKARKQVKQLKQQQQPHKSEPVKATEKAKPAKPAYDEAAVVKIQAAARGYQARKQVKGLRKEKAAAAPVPAPAHPPAPASAPAVAAAASREMPPAYDEAAVVKIQAAARGYQARKQVKELKKKQPRQPQQLEAPKGPADEEAKPPYDEAAVIKIQAAARGYQARKQVKELKQQQRPKQEQQKEPAAAAAPAEAKAAAPSAGPTPTPPAAPASLVVFGADPNAPQAPHPAPSPTAMASAEPNPFAASGAQQVHPPHPPLTAGPSGTASPRTGSSRLSSGRSARSDPPQTEAAVHLSGKRSVEDMALGLPPGGASSPKHMPSPQRPPRSSPDPAKREKLVVKRPPSITSSRNSISDHSSQTSLGAQAAAPAAQLPAAAAPTAAPVLSTSEQEEAAAVRIQAYQRGHRARKEVAEMRRAERSTSRGAAPGASAAAAAAAAGLAAAAATHPPLPPPLTTVDSPQLHSPAAATSPVLSLSPGAGIPPPPSPTLGSVRRPPSRNAAIAQVRAALLSSRSSTPAPSTNVSLTGPFSPPVSVPGSVGGSGALTAPPPPPPLSNPVSSTMSGSGATSNGSDRASSTNGGPYMAAGGPGGAHQPHVMTPYISLTDYFRAPEAALRAIGSSRPRSGAGSALSDSHHQHQQHAPGSGSGSGPASFASTPPGSRAGGPRPSTASLSAVSAASTALTGGSTITPRADEVLELHADMLSSALAQLKLMKARDSVKRSSVDSKALLQLKLEYVRLAVEQAMGGASVAAAPLAMPPLGADAGEAAGGGGSALPGLPGTGASEELQRPVNRHGAARPRPGAEVAPAVAAAGGGGGGGGGGDGGRPKEQDVDALMTELTDLRMLLLTTSNALHAAHSGLHQERASRHALSTELAEMQRKLAALSTGGRPGSGRPASGRAVPALVTGTPLSPSSPAPGPFAAAPGVASPSGSTTRPWSASRSAPDQAEAARGLHAALTASGKSRAAH